MLGCENESLTSYVGICSCSEPIVYDFSGSAIGRNLFDNRIRPDIRWNMLVGMVLFSFVRPFRLKMALVLIVSRGQVLHMTLVIPIQLYVRWRLAD